jgi:hypothetical protein
MKEEMLAHLRLYHASRGLLIHHHGRGQVANRLYEVVQYQSTLRDIAETSLL